MSNSILGLLDGDGLDEIYLIKLVLLGFDPYYPLCSKIDVAMTLLCLMLVTLGPGAMISDLNLLCFHEYMCVLDPILQVYSHLLCVMIRQPRSDNNQDHSR